MVPRDSHPLHQQYGPQVNCNNSPVAAAQKHQSVGLVREHPEGSAGCQVAQLGRMQEAFGGYTKKNYQL